MSEWVKEHAWKAIRATHPETLRSVFDSTVYSFKLLLDVTR
jgi:hypothetical protein